MRFSMFLHIFKLNFVYGTSNSDFKLIKNVPKGVLGKKEKWALKRNVAPRPNHAELEPTEPAQICGT